MRLRSVPGHAGVASCVVLILGLGLGTTIAQSQSSDEQLASLRDQLATAAKSGDAQEVLRLSDAIELLESEASLEELAADVQKLLEVYRERMSQAAESGDTQRVREIAVDIARLEANAPVTHDSVAGSWGLVEASGGAQPTADSPTVLEVITFSHRTYRLEQQATTEERETECDTALGRDWQSGLRIRAEREELHGSEFVVQEGSYRIDTTQMRVVVNREGWGPDLILEQAGTQLREVGGDGSCSRVYDRVPDLAPGSGQFVNIHKVAPLPGVPEDRQREARVEYALTEGIIDDTEDWGPERTGLLTLAILSGRSDLVKSLLEAGVESSPFLVGTLRAAPDGVRGFLLRRRRVDLQLSLQCVTKLRQVPVAHHLA